MPLSGKRIVIAGGARFIGTTLALPFATSTTEAEGGCLRVFDMVMSEC